MDNSFIELIHQGDEKFAIVLAGGGSSAISRLLEVPGASNTLLSAFIPYHEVEMNQYLGGKPDSACSSQTARALAMVAWQRAKAIVPGRRTFGIGVTAALATNRTRRGEDRCFLAVQSIESTRVMGVVFDKSGRTREEEEQKCSELILRVMGETSGLTINDQPFLRNTDKLTDTVHKADPTWQSLLEGKIVKTRELESSCFIFPGAFNPLHAGHLAMKEYARNKMGARVAFEISVFNVDKPPLDYIEMQNRSVALKDQLFVYTNAPTFVEKCRLFPGATFIVGIDTLTRIDQKKYYNDSETQRDAAIREMADKGNQFLVFGRQSGNEFLSLRDINLTMQLRDICIAVDESEFRQDISSSELRQNDQSKHQ